MCRVHKPQAIRGCIIEDYFAQQDMGDGVYVVTGVGEFVPSSLSRVYRGLMQLMDEGFIGRDATFLDAGSGDGRVVVLTSFVLGLMSYGVEYDETLWQRSLTNINFFRRFYQDAAHLPMVLWGDFCDEETYTRFGTRFTVFDVVFYYANNYHNAIFSARLSETSPIGHLTTLLLQFFPGTSGLWPIEEVAATAASWNHAHFSYLRKGGP
ncbi:MAG: hypothetical protein ACUVWY_10490 [Desulfosoma sp.]|uniref:hypothetical protein n=1 Tax=Desulfosoma sp. TaxID=2603217 RepID=UPI00404AC0CA